VLARRPAAFLGVSSRQVGAALLALVALGFALRAWIVLHPQFFYPDVRVHGLFALVLVKSGLTEFLRDFTANQYRYSLGLQMQNGHWYAFPYPPLFYIATWPLTRLAHYRGDLAVSLLAALANSLEALLVFGIARRLRASDALALLAASAHAILPLFTNRLSLAYFPDLTGHAVDALLMLYLLRHLGDFARPRVVVTFAVLLAIALLTYPQSLLNFGLTLPIFLVVQALLDRSREARRFQLAFVIAGALGVGVALGSFYGRYVPIVRDMEHGVPMPEEAVLLAHPVTPPRADDPPPVDPAEKDPFFGPDLDLWRGVRKGAFRLAIFYGPYASFLALGLALVWAHARQADAMAARLVLLWALTYWLLNLGSAGLPSPNMIRYNKDLEFVAPVCCVALAACGIWLWERGRVGRALALFYGAGFAGFAALRAVRYLTETFVFER
jgi:hypothetical protein